MNLIDFKKSYDFGHEWSIRILTIKRWTLLQLALSWSDYAMWPFIQIKSGTGYGLSILFWAYKFGLDLDIISRTWERSWMDDSETVTEET